MLDATFDLTSESFWPYRKPNSDPLYIHTSSNHSPNFKKQLPNMISKRLSQNSSNKSDFEKAATDYEEVLQKSGYNIKLQYKVPKKPKSRNRKRNTIWFNPPYNAIVKTNIGRIFLSVNPISSGLFSHPISTVSKNSLVSDRRKIFCFLKLFFVRFFK